MTPPFGSSRRFPLRSVDHDWLGVVPSLHRGAMPPADFLPGRDRMPLSVSRSTSCMGNHPSMAPCRAMARAYISSSCTSPLTVGPQDRNGFIVAFSEVENVKALYAEYLAAGAMFDQKLEKQA